MRRSAAEWNGQVCASHEEQQVKEEESTYKIDHQKHSRLMTPRTNRWAEAIELVRHHHRSSSSSSGLVSLLDGANKPSKSIAVQAFQLGSAEGGRG